MSPCRGQQAPPWMGALRGDSLGTPLTCLGRQQGWEDPKGWGLPSLFPSATPSAGALLLPSLRGQRCCDNQDGLIGPMTAQHSPTGVTWVTATPKCHQSWLCLIPAPLLGCKDSAITMESLRGPCHHTLHCARVGTHSQPLPWHQRQSQIYTPGSSQSNKGFILTEPVPVSLSRPGAHCGWIRAEPTPKPVVPWGAAKHLWVLHPWKLGGFIVAALKPAMGMGRVPRGVPHPHPAFPSPGQQGHRRGHRGTCIGDTGPRAGGDVMALLGGCDGLLVPTEAPQVQAGVGTGSQGPWCHGV